MGSLKISALFELNLMFIFYLFNKNSTLFFSKIDKIFNAHLILLFFVKESFVPFIIKFIQIKEERLRTLPNMDLFSTKERK